MFFFVFRFSLRAVWNNFPISGRYTRTMVATARLINHSPPSHPDRSPVLDIHHTMYNSSHYIYIYSNGQWARLGIPDRVLFRKHVRHSSIHCFSGRSTKIWTRSTMPALKWYNRREMWASSPINLVKFWQKSSASRTKARSLGQDRQARRAAVEGGGGGVVPEHTRWGWYSDIIVRIRHILANTSYR